MADARVYARGADVDSDRPLSQQQNSTRSVARGRTPVIDSRAILHRRTVELYFFATAADMTLGGACFRLDFFA